MPPGSTTFTTSHGKARVCCPRSRLFPLLQGKFQNFCDAFDAYLVSGGFGDKPLLCFKYRGRSCKTIDVEMGHFHVFL